MSRPRHSRSGTVADLANDAAIPLISEDDSPSPLLGRLMGHGFGSSRQNPRMRFDRVPPSDVDDAAYSSSESHKTSPMRKATTSFGYSSPTSGLNHDLDLHLSEEMMIAPWDSSSMFYEKILFGVLKLPELFLTLIWSNASVNDPLTFASAFGDATAASICNHYGPHQVYPYAGCFIKSIILGRYLDQESTVYRPPTHATRSGTRTKTVQILIDRQRHTTHVTMMGAIQESARLHNDRLATFHSVIADVRQSPHAMSTLGVPVPPTM
jgi:hypothetical protein